MNHGGHGALQECDERLVDTVITAAIRVHQELGPGLMESIYELALIEELADAGVEAKRQVEIPVRYRGKPLGVGFRADIVVENSLLIEVKSVSELTDVHTAQIMTYLKLLRFKRGFLINFNKKLLKNGLKRISI
ncbi:GxxExxY protein [Candidatus Poribacteria bacterium]|nr:GxxExxY protein [Candidatus Poribacteria bacterium]